MRAWNALGAGPRPARLELLRRRRKSVVYRLPGVGAGGSDVIAKQALWQDALDERAVYEVLSEEPELLVPPEPIRLPPELLLPAAGALLLLLLLPVGPRRALGIRVSLARSASLSVVLLTASFPVVIVSGCGTPPPVRLFHVDHLGSTQVVTDYEGNLYRQLRYYAYGESRGRFDAGGSAVGYTEDARFEFTGYETDFAGLDYAGARFFDPELGQFGTHDPAGQYPSPYAYGPGDPVNGTDPSGADFWDVFQYGSPQMFALTSIVRTYQATGSWGKAIGQFAKNWAISSTVGLITLNPSYLGLTLLGMYAASEVVLGARSGNGLRIAMGVVMLLGAAYGAYQLSTSPGVSGTELAQNVQTSQSAEGDLGIQYAQAGGQSNPFAGDYFEVRPPDADGYLTLGEATWQWRNGQGAPVDVDLNTLDLSGVRGSEFAGPGSKLLFSTAKPWDFLVHGSITLQMNPNGTVSALTNTYNFDMKPWGVQTFIRNVEAWTGARYAGPGQQFDIHFRGSVAVRP